jgi:membrane associated rhomboid family serine protease
MLWNMFRQGIQPFIKQKLSTLRPQFNQFRQNSFRFFSSNPLKSRLSLQRPFSFRESSRSFLSNPLYIITTINTTVFLGWCYAELRRINGDSTVLLFMYKHFTLISSNPIPWTFFTSIFSHRLIVLLIYRDPMHFILNSFVLWNFIPSFVGLVSQRMFWPFYFGAGLFGGLGQILYDRFNQIDNRLGFFTKRYLGDDGKKLLVLVRVGAHPPSSHIQLLSVLCQLSLFWGSSLRQWYLFPVYFLLDSCNWRGCGLRSLFCFHSAQQSVWTFGASLWWIIWSLVVSLSLVFVALIFKSIPKPV